MPTPFTFPLEPAPTTPEDTNSSVVTPTLGEIVEPAFLGTGLIRPFQRDKKNDFASASGLRLIKSCVGQILGTRASSPGTRGEIPWRPKFGSKLHLLRHKKGPMLQELGRVYVVDALRLWEPRVTVTDVVISRLERTLRISLRYHVIDQNVPGNNVLISDVSQDVDVPLAA